MATREEEIKITILCFCLKEGKGQGELQKKASSSVFFLTGPLGLANYSPLAILLSKSVLLEHSYSYALSIAAPVLSWLG